MHHGGDDTKLPRHGAKLVKEQLIEDVRCPGCGKWAPSGCYTPPALKDARRHEGLGCVGCRGKKATEEYADTVRVHLNEADEAGKPEIHEWQEWNEDYTAPLHERVVERDADLNPAAEELETNRRWYGKLLRGETSSNHAWFGLLSNADYDVDGDGQKITKYKSTFSAIYENFEEVSDEEQYLFKLACQMPDFAQDWRDHPLAFAPPIGNHERRRKRRLLPALLVLD
ncbi:unnamed protein product [Zymoseptoria tritici ST99CH_1E4]|uniref:Uncharacterized protein n=1 Tax=Zymoseptoria tritici ST99CH_1E4 TaxID=1276532 RepID=A0A2H1GXG4_ZYMTR|nr:unnamed protein product [Zymoseptoria tritici ST99CH_1E4]